MTDDKSAIIYQNKINKSSLLFSVRGHTVNKEKTFPYLKYISYIIKFEINLESWEIVKRFRSFEELDNKLAKTMRDLPKLPKKHIFKLSEDIIKQRKVKLGEYLHLLIKMVNLFESKEILDFIGISGDLLMFFANLCDKNCSNVRKKVKSASVKDICSSLLEKHDDYQADDINPLIELIQELKEGDENICENTAKFWVKFKDKIKKDSRNDIKNLFFGNGSQNKGLIYHCGNVEENILGAEACLCLISKLIDFETNQDCEFYTNIFRMIRLEEIEMMRFELHLKSHIPDVLLSAFKILKVIYDNGEGFNIFSIVKDELIVEKYRTFLDNIE